MLCKQWHVKVVSHWMRYLNLRTTTSRNLHRLLKRARRLLGALAFSLHSTVGRLHHRLWEESQLVKDWKDRIEFPDVLTPQQQHIVWNNIAIEVTKATGDFIVGHWADTSIEKCLSYGYFPGFYALSNHLQIKLYDLGNIVLGKLQAFNETTQKRKQSKFTPMVAFVQRFIKEVTFDYPTVQERAEKAIAVWLPVLGSYGPNDKQALVYSQWPYYEFIMRVNNIVSCIMTTTVMILHRNHEPVQRTVDAILRDQDVKGRFIVCLQLWESGFDAARLALTDNGNKYGMLFQWLIERYVAICMKDRVKKTDSSCEWV